MRFKLLFFLMVFCLAGDQIVEPKQGVYAIAPIVLAGIIAGVSALAGSIINTSSSKKQMQATNKANMDLAQYQADANEKLIDKQNQYNTPAMQMLRYQDAKLNPNLVYSQGSSGNQAQAARYEAPRVDMHFTPFQIPDMIGMYQDLSAKQAQIDMTNAQTDSIQERTLNEAVRRNLMLAQTKMSDSQRKRLEKFMPLDYEVRRQESLLRGNQVLSEGRRASILGNQGAILEHTKNDLIEQQRYKTTFMRYEDAFRKQGINNSDHFIVRMLSRMLLRAGIE